MPEPTFQAVPVLRMFDVAKAKAFYLDFLGMTLDWEHRFDADAPLYMQLSRGGLTLQLSEHHGDGTPGSVVYVQTDGLAGYHAEIGAKGYAFMRPGLEPAPWGGQLMEVIDPSGNRLRFSGP